MLKLIYKILFIEIFLLVSLHIFSWKLCGDSMSIKPQDLLNSKKDLEKKVKFENISLNNISIDDLSYNGNNYNQFINLNSFLENVSSCQISDAFNEIAHRSGVLYNLKSINLNV